MFQHVGDATAVIRGYPVQQWILWAGAGISFNGPTDLPLGEPLTRFVLDRACGAGVRSQLLDIWQEANTLCASAVSSVPLGWIPRLESILEAINEVEGDTNDHVQFMRGFESFTEAPPNALHYSLASCVLRGAWVVTTNFDLCIEHAAEELSGSVGPTIQFGSGLFSRFEFPAVPGAGAILHVHGVASDTRRLGATLAAVKEGLTQDFTDWLEERLEQGSVLAFVGYSMSDAFDVTPYFASRTPRCWPDSTLVSVQHLSTPLPRAAAAIATGFGSCVAAGADTAALLLNLGLPLQGLTATHPRFDWGSAFLRRLSAFDPSLHGAVLACSIANTVGINSEILAPGAYARAEHSRPPGYSTRAYHHALAIAARGRGDSEAERRHHIMAGLHDHDLLGYQYARGALLRAWRSAMSLKELSQLVHNVPETLSWRPYTSMSVHLRNALARYLLLPWTAPTHRRTKYLQELMNVASWLGERPLRTVNAIHQVATARRASLLLSALLYRSLDEDEEQRILALYGEQAHIGGFVSSYRDFALVRTILLRYTPASSRRDDLVSEAQVLLDRSQRLARLVGDRAAQRRSAAISRLLRWAALFR